MMLQQVMLLCQFVEVEEPYCHKVGSGSVAERQKKSI